MLHHHDPAVDSAWRANMGAGFHFFDPDNQRFRKSKSIAGTITPDGRFAFVVERYGTVHMGTVCVQMPHSRVVRVDLTTGETDYMTEACHYRTNARALKAARRFATEVAP